MSYEVVIVGGGLAAHVLALHLDGPLLQRAALITGDGARNVPPTAVLHAHPGKRVVCTPCGVEGFSYAKKWLHGVQATTSTRLIRPLRVYRPALLAPECDDAVTRCAARDLPRELRHFDACFTYPDGYSIDARALVAHLASSLALQGLTSFNDFVVSVQSVGALWQLRLRSGHTIEAQRVVLAAGSGLVSLLPWSGLGYNRGSLLQVPAGVLAGDFLVSSNGHCAPSPQGGHIIGSTYHHLRRQSDGSTIAPVLNPHLERARLLAIAHRLLAPELPEEAAEVWSGERATVPQDKKPIVGRVPTCSGLPLYIFGNFASKGFFRAPYLASRLAAALPHDLPVALPQFSPQRVKGFCAVPW